MSKTSNKKTESRTWYEPRGRGIYCIETNWYQDEHGQEDATSLRPILQLLKDGYWGVPFIWRDVATSSELFYYIRKWLTSDFPILYLGFHGSERGKLWLETEDGSANMVNHEVLENHLEGRCKNKVIHFSGCSVLNGMDTKQFLKSTEASAVSGYKDDVDTDAYALEYLYLQNLQYFRGNSLTPTVARDVAAALKESPYKDLCKHFSFDIKAA